jgi:hypothetical protein
VEKMHHQPFCCGTDQCHQHCSQSTSLHKDSDGSVYNPKRIVQQPLLSKSLMHQPAENRKSDAGHDFAEYCKWPVNAFFKTVKISSHMICSIEVDLEDGHPLARQLCSSQFTGMLA